MVQPHAAAIYCRISQDRDGTMLGVRRQESACRELADHKGWPVTEVYVDDDRSAYSGKSRPAYEAMLAALEAGERDAVIVLDHDRLTRHPAELEAFIELADRCGVALANTSGDLDLATSDGRFRARILGAVARQESEKKSERLRRQREQAARAGRPHPGPRAFGWKPGHTEHDDAEAALIRAAASDVLAGVSMRSIADRWNAEGITTARGRPWNVNRVRDVLTRPSNAGIRVHRGEAVGDGDWKPILDRATWERLAAAARQRARRGRPPTRLLSGLAECGICGGPMRTNVGKAGARIYACRRLPGTDSCGRLSIDADQADAEISEQIIAVLAGPALSAAVAASAAAESQSVGDERASGDQLAADEQRLDQLAADYGDELITRREWLAARERITARIAATRRRLHTESGRSVIADLPTDVQGLRSWWGAADTSVRRAVVAALIERLVVIPRQPGAQRRFDPDRLAVTDWRV